jgi:hypothetical protein
LEARRGLMPRSRQSAYYLRTKRFSAAGTAGRHRQSHRKRAAEPRSVSSILGSRRRWRSKHEDFIIAEVISS